MALRGALVRERLEGRRVAPAQLPVLFPSLCILCRRQPRGSLPRWRRLRGTWLRVPLGLRLRVVQRTLPLRRWFLRVRFILRHTLRGRSLLI